jgi:ADP-ribose diphosphatase
MSRPAPGEPHPPVPPIPPIPNGIQLLSSRRTFEGRVFSVREDRLRLPSGLLQEVAVVEHPGAVAIAALTEEGELLLVRQYRHPARDWLLEVPAGRLEAGESPLAAAQRELEEETGCQARTWIELRSFFPAVGFCSEVTTLFLARGILQSAAPARRPDSDEELELARATPEELLGGDCQDAKTLIAAAEVLRWRSSHPNAE